MAASIQRSLQLRKSLFLRLVPQVVSVQRGYVASPAVEKFAKYGGRNTVTALTGDGVGPELLACVQKVFRFAGAPVVFEEVEVDANTSDSEYLNKALLSVGRNGVAIKGNIATNHDSSQVSMNVKLRTELDLFANVIRCKSLPGVSTRHGNIDMILIRENTEGEYTNLEHENVSGVIESLKIITEANSTKIAKYAFEYAKKYGRKKVTAVHKANIMKLGDGLFLNCCRNVSEDYPDIEFNDMIIDNASMQMVSRPQQFDVLVMPNLYGNILSNIATGLVGGSGVVGGVNIGEDYAVFEMGTRNTGMKLKGTNTANPTGLLLASCDMLDYLGHKKYGSLIREAVLNVLNEKRIHTPDLGGQSSTTDVIQAILDDIKPGTKA
ncbi:Isocitrate dehydrogenase [NAD] subunit gamma 1 [Mactra antiquata]